MNFVKASAAMILIISVAGCAVRPDKGADRGIDRKHLSQLKAGIWVDPNGCDHWIIDDGLEGYLSQRLDKFGKPVCSGIAPGGTAVGGFKDGSWLPDPRGRSKKRN